MQGFACATIGPSISGELCSSQRCHESQCSCLTFNGKLLVSFSGASKRTPPEMPQKNPHATMEAHFNFNLRTPNWYYILLMCIHLLMSHKEGGWPQCLPHTPWVAWHPFATCQWHPRHSPPPSPTQPWGSAKPWLGEGRRGRRGRWRDFIVSGSVWLIPWKTLGRESWGPTDLPLPVGTSIILWAVLIDVNVSLGLSSFPIFRWPAGPFSPEILRSTNSSGSFGPWEPQMRWFGQELLLCLIISQVSPSGPGRILAKWCLPWMKMDGACYRWD